jgi:predicted Zn finger-like uncharacterized protein
MRQTNAQPIRHALAAVLANCPLCDTSLVVSHIIPGPAGLEHWTLRCTRCGHIHQDAVDTLRPASSQIAQVPAQISI